MPHADPVITLALQTEIRPGRAVWNFYDDAGALIGWSPDLPGPHIMQPSCFQYGTGNHLDVTFAAGANTLHIKP